MTSTLGPLVRLRGISIHQLPPSGKGVSPSNALSSSEKFSDGSGVVAALTLPVFINKVLSEAVPFIDSVAPKSGQTSQWKTKGSPKHYATSEAPVELFERNVSAKELSKIDGLSKVDKDETWFCRRSVHRNAPDKGTASWDEFVRSFRENHPQTEEDFTPAVIGAREAILWDASAQEATIDGGKWNGITLIVVEMKHKIEPKPLKNRTFPVVQLTAQLEGNKEFVVVSIPLTDFEKSPYAEYARDKTLVIGAYTSIERIRALPSGETEWIMATASDAKGSLPQWMQKMAVPSAVAKDVDMFLGWIPKRRGEHLLGAPVENGKGTVASDKSLPPAPTAGTESPGDTPPPISKTSDDTPSGNGVQEASQQVTV